ncbi:MAG: nucleoside hydrolase [Kiritimatiellae bacterium]|nr:nucleoside hydrolase [Kiritimatiellia bacterium]
MMKQVRLSRTVGILLFAAGFGALAVAGGPMPVKKEPVKVIFDTDMYTDFDDAGALACLHALADAGECEILAVVSNTRDCMSVAMCEIVNEYYGRSELPVGCSKMIGRTGADESHRKRYGPTVEKYRKWVRHLNSDDAPDANGVYRRVLASQPDNSVVVCSVGFLTNMRRLLETEPDAISPLDGRALVARKVKRWVAMACRYPAGREYNSMIDPESSRIALEKWPTQVVFTEWNYGFDCFAGRLIAESGMQGNPVADVFAGNIPSREEIRGDAARYLRGSFGMGGRAAWDQTAVLIAVRGTEPYFNVTRGRYRMTGDDGGNEWVPDGTGSHMRVTEKVSKREVGRIIDELMLRPPALEHQ